jgi:hypothetical protein
MNTINVSIENASNAPEVIKKVYKCGENDYNIYNYKRENKAHDLSASVDTEQPIQLNDDDNYNELGNYRSVITYNDNIVAVAPIKSSSFDLTKQLTANEVIEGTMINLFYNKCIGSWEIATKSAIGGNYWFYRTQYDGSLEFNRQMTFREMFMESLCEDPNSDLNASNVVKQLNIDYNYSFVMQHPANHIVLNIMKPTLYLVAGFKIDNDVITHCTPDDMNNLALNCSVDNLPILFPLQVDVVGKNMEEISQISSYYNAGIMLHGKNGKRFKVINETYERLKNIRGNNPNIHYHYLSLFAAGNVNQFLYEFPGYKQLFYLFYRQSYGFIKEIHDAYVSYYVNKKGKTVRINKSLFTHIYTIHHNYFIPSIESESPTIVTRNIVANYYNSMSPKEKLYHVNYKTRDFINNQRTTTLSANTEL